MVFIPPPDLLYFGGMNSFIIEEARAADRAELLDFLHTAFATNDPKKPIPRFETLYPDLFDATDDAMGRHRVIRNDAGRVGACVGAYPMRVRVGACELDIFGIGQVSCDPAARGGGRMTALMNDACARMEKSGAALAWLGGRRDRYAHFGFDLAGSNLSSGMDKRSAGAPAPGWRVEQVDAAQLARFWVLRNRAATLEDVSPEKWTTRLLCGGKPDRIFLASRGKDAEAVCVTQGEGEGGALLEWAGETDGIHAVCAHLLAAQPWVNAVYAPSFVDPAAGMFWSHAAWSGVSLSNLRILNLAALLEGYAPFLENRVPAGAGARLVVIENNDAAQLGAAHGETLALDRLAMVRLMFGPLPPSQVVKLPEALRWLDQVFPLPFLLPPSSHV